MARPPNLDPIRAVIRALGDQIGQALAASIQAAAQVHAPATQPAQGKKQAAPVVSRRGCPVPGCHRQIAAKGLCQMHYAKGRKLKMNLDSLSAAQLRTLGEDGRAKRWKK